MMSAFFRRHNSRQLMVPLRLVLIIYSGLSPNPASTDGSAEASIIRPISSSRRRSSGLRISPWTSLIPASFNLGRFNSEPRRLRLSKAMTFKDGYFRLKERARLLPIKPAPPVIRIVLYLILHPHLTSPIEGEELYAII